MEALRLPLLSLIGSAMDSVIGYDGPKIPS
jgi:hypothetical protein